MLLPFCIGLPHDACHTSCPRCALVDCCPRRRHRHSFCAVHRLQPRRTPANRNRNQIWPLICTHTCAWCASEHTLTRTIWSRNTRTCKCPAYDGMCRVPSQPVRCPPLALHGTRRQAAATSTVCRRRYSRWLAQCSHVPAHSCRQRMLRVCARMHA
jgi:hypothetical protein